MRIFPDGTIPQEDIWEIKVTDSILIHRIAMVQPKWYPMRWVYRLLSITMI